MISGLLRTSSLTLDKIVPNPSEGNVTVTFTSVAAGFVRVEVFDGLGREVRVSNINAQSGKNEHIVNLPATFSGLFTVRLASGSESVTGTFIKK
jgi:hypothetical protein